MAQHSIEITSSIDYLPAFSLTPSGVLVLRHLSDGDTWEIRRADPHVTFSWQTLHMLAGLHNPNGGVEYPCMSLQRVSHEHDETCGDLQPGDFCFSRWLLRIDADRHVIYQIGRYDRRRETWTAAWPD